ncbi:hypothetical protein Tco_0044402 [Tanacetum coccineum]
MNNRPNATGGDDQAEARVGGRARFGGATPYARCESRGWAAVERSKAHRGPPPARPGLRGRVGWERKRGERIGEGGNCVS